MQKWLWRVDVENRRGKEDEKDWTKRISACQRVPEKRAGRYERESASVGADVREIEAVIGEMGYPARSWHAWPGPRSRAPASIALVAGRPQCRRRGQPLTAPRRRAKQMSRPTNLGPGPTLLL